MKQQKGFDNLTGPIDPNKVPAVMDGEFEADLSIIRKCEKCGSFNISIDNTGEYHCRDCKQVSKSATKVDFQKMVQNMVEKDVQDIQLRMKRGETFGSSC